MGGRRLCVGDVLKTDTRITRQLVIGGREKGPYLLSSEPTAKGTGLEESAGKEDPVELDSSPTL